MSLQSKVRRFVRSHDLPDLLIPLWSTTPERFAHLKKTIPYLERQGLSPGLINTFNTPQLFELLKPLTRFVKAHDLDYSFIKQNNTQELFDQLKSNVQFRDRLNKYIQAHPHADVARFLPYHWRTADREVNFKRLQSHTRRAELQQLVQIARDMDLDFNNRISKVALQQLIDEHLAFDPTIFEHPQPEWRVIGNNGAGYTRVVKINPVMAEDLIECENQIADIVQDQATVFLQANHPNALKFRLSVRMEMEKPNQPTSELIWHNKITPRIVQQTTDIQPQLQLAFQELAAELDAHTANGSGWTLIRVDQVVLQMIIYNPIRGGTFAELPKWIQNKHACINVKNPCPKNDLNCEDSNCVCQQCFAQAIRASILNPAKNGERLSMYKSFQDSEHDLDFSRVKFPMEVDRIRYFEDRNPKYAITVMGLETDDSGDQTQQIYCMRSCQAEDRDSRITIVLLYFNNHYCWVKNIDALIGPQNGNKSFNCTHCCNGYTTHKALLNHRLFNCNLNAPVREQMPNDKDLELKYSNKYFSGGRTAANIERRLPFILVCDTETAIHPDGTHVPVMSSVKVVCVDQNFSSPVKVYESGTKIVVKNGCEESVELGNPVKQFLDDLPAIHKDIKSKVYSKFKDLRRPTKTFPRVGNGYCYICEDLCLEEKEEGALNPMLYYEDICPFTKVSHGVGHKLCIQKARFEAKIPVFFHNLTGFDGHLIIKALSKEQLIGPESESKKDPEQESKSEQSEPKQQPKKQSEQESKEPKKQSEQQSKEPKKKSKKPKQESGVKVLSLNQEKMLTFSINDFVFMDSARHLNSSLSSLVDVQRKSGCQFKNTVDHFGDKSNLITRKGIYPYEWLTSEDKLKETKLPSIEKFNSKLSGGGVTVDEYKYAQEVFDKFKCKSMRDYTRIYLIADTTLLADVIEAYRDKNIEEHGIDPAHFLTLPSVAWNALLKSIAGVHKIDLIADADMYRWVEQSIRGGLSVVSHRHAKASNEVTLIDMAKRFVMLY